jgi:hypothetical protein
MNAIVASCVLLVWGIALFTCGVLAGCILAKGWEILL